MMKHILATTYICASVSCAFASVTSVTVTEPARDWQQSSLTGNGTIGAMVEGRLESEVIHLSHCELYLPEPVIDGKYRERDGFMAACDLKIAQWMRRTTEYSRTTDFLTGEVIVRATDDRNRRYVRKVVALRPANLIAIRIDDEAKGNPAFALDAIAVSSDIRNREVQIRAKGVKRTVLENRGEYDYYRVDFKQENPWNPLAGYEVVLKSGRTEAFVAIEPLRKGQDSNFGMMASRLDDAARKGYAALLAEHAPRQREMMERVSLELDCGDERIERNFAAGRYNVISSTGGKHVPNLQGLWAGTWSAPWKASFTVNGNLPCAISFFAKGNTPELNECLLAWMEARMPEFREEAARRKARGFRIAAQTTVSGIETDFNGSYPHHLWHGGAWWLTSRLYDGYRHTLDKTWLERIYPLMKDCAEYYTDVLKPMADGSLGFDPSYSPENWPAGKRPTSVNATMDNAMAKQCFRWTAEAAEILGVDRSERGEWLRTAAKLTPFQVSEGGFFAEWLAPGQPDNNEHRHASHLYALYDEANEEILSNPALCAAVKKTIDARMDFNERRSRTMAFGYVQNGLSAARLGDAARAERCLRLLTEKNWNDAGGSYHDWHNVFNTDVSGGYPYLIAEMLVQAEMNGEIKFFPAKPKAWKKGTLKGVMLRGNRHLDELKWDESGYTATITGPMGKQTFAGSADAF